MLIVPRWSNATLESSRFPPATLSAPPLTNVLLAGPAPEIRRTSPEISGVVRIVPPAPFVNVTPLAREIVAAYPPADATSSQMALVLVRLELTNSVALL